MSQCHSVIHLYPLLFQPKPTFLCTHNVERNQTTLYHLASFKHYDITGLGVGGSKLKDKVWHNTWSVPNINKVCNPPFSNHYQLYSNLFGKEIETYNPPVLVLFILVNIEVPWVLCYIKINLLISTENTRFKPLFK